VPNLPPLYKKWGFRRLAKLKVFGTHEGERPLALSRLLYRLKSESPGIHGVLITGDLAASGAEADLDAAQAYLATRNSGFPREPYGLAQDDQVLLLMPGNHDRYSPTLGWSGGTLFDEKFKAVWGVGWGAKFWHRFDGQSERLVLLAADFCLAPGTRRPTKAWGTGRVCARTLSSMKELTRAVSTGTAKEAVLWCVHFPPNFEVNGDPVVPRHLRLDQCQTLLEAAQSLQVQAILCGHLHEEHCPIGSAPALLCAGTATAYEGEEFVNSVLIHEFDVEGGVILGIRHTRYKWDQSRCEFISERLP